MNDVQLVARFVREFRMLRPNLVLSYTIKNNIYGAMASRRTNVTFVPTVTGLGTAFLASSLLRQVACALYRHAFKHLDHVVFQNCEDFGEFLKYRLVSQRQILLIPGSGVDTTRFQIAPMPSSDERKFLMIGRMLRDKGVEEYVAAARICKLADPRLRFSLIGPADAQNNTAISLEQLQAWDKEGFVSYLGPREDVRSDIASAHCIVLPSYREGMSRVLLEAACMGRPLIATDVPGCRDIVEDGVNGYLCTPADSRDLARKLQSIATLPVDVLTKMGHEGRAKVVKSFADEIVIPAYLKMITETDRL